MSRKSSTTSSASSSTSADPSATPQTELNQFSDLLSSLCLNDQPDLGGLILGNVLKSQRSRPNFDAETATSVLVDVGNAIRQWRSDLKVGMCPLCDTTV